MSLIFDILLVALVVITVVLTAKKGFAKSIAKTLAFILALVLTILITEPVSNFVYDKFLSSKFETAVSNVFESSLNNAESKIDEELTAAIDSMPSFVSDFVKDKGFSAADIIDSANPETATPENLAADFSDKYIKPAAVSFINYIIALIIFIIAYFILLFVLKIVASVLSAGIFGLLDTVLGGALGVVNGFIYVTAICVCVALLSRLVPGEFLTTLTEGSKISSFILGLLPFTI